MGERPSQSGLARGMRIAIRNDSSAFSYSVLVTCTFGVVTLDDGHLTGWRLLLFAWGATGAFALWEAIVSRFFSIRLRGEASDVVVLGTALAPLSVGLALAAAVGISTVVAGTIEWLVTPAVATSVYVTVSGAQLEFARRRQEQRPPSDSG